MDVFKAHLSNLRQDGNRSMWTQPKPCHLSVTCLHQMPRSRDNMNPPKVDDFMEDVVPNGVEWS
jgi:hypothetical protein